MVRLSTIKPEILEEIERYVRSKKLVIPVVSEGENLIDQVEARFGYRLSPQQIYKLQKDEKRYHLKLDTDLVSQIEKDYGSVEKALRCVTPLSLPANLKDAEKTYKKFLEYGKIRMRELDEVLGKEAYKDISRLGKFGYIHREGDFLVATRTPHTPIFELLRSVKK